MPAHKDHVQVFAVVRLDLSTLHTQPELSIKIVEVLPDGDAAAAEATRLNQLNQHKGARYLTQATHWYPQGRHAPATPPKPTNTPAPDMPSSHHHTEDHDLRLEY